MSEKQRPSNDHDAAYYQKRLDGAVRGFYNLRADEIDCLSKAYSFSCRIRSTKAELSAAVEMESIDSTLSGVSHNAFRPSFHNAMAMLKIRYLRSALLRVDRDLFKAIRKLDDTALKRENHQHALQFILNEVVGSGYVIGTAGARWALDSAPPSPEYFFLPAGFGANKTAYTVFELTNYGKWLLREE
ncbi:hypothetical protein GQ43DRAFT_469743 [Delitschia confertaspora ATCC 74209]|uniref:Uncharacterized protein n=1 Tax=Delitschia confertaspora ATCC 74209 TaxID=1513339 RepID=A0A9P4MV47_9PLEO|nr:hypothetical protein GQ43DRAFT_469743 [Delitschia confertaspora ATCC 74209]